MGGCCRSRWWARDRPGCMPRRRSRGTARTSGSTSWTRSRRRSAWSVTAWPPTTRSPSPSPAPCRPSSSSPVCGSWATWPSVTTCRSTSCTSSTTRSCSRPARRSTVTWASRGRTWPGASRRPTWSPGTAVTRTPRPTGSGWTPARSSWSGRATSPGTWRGCSPGPGRSWRSPTSPATCWRRSPRAGSRRCTWSRDGDRPRPGSPLASCASWAGWPTRTSSSTPPTSSRTTRAAPTCSRPPRRGATSTSCGAGRTAPLSVAPDGCTCTSSADR